ncbi:hypothetical protein G5714_024571 [Onychostoma macrolepis]|uniref:Uncharacterized protein n=1 Tax=Onychostoma macrolepis TaxID=369639 RepID=A0A7J6BHN8_9TELE|nr:hypothetical protein G5714_024571 [Onychostoma macrolepis]
MKVKAGARGQVGSPPGGRTTGPSRPHRRAGGARRVRWYPKMVNYAWAGEARGNSALKMDGAGRRAHTRPSAARKSMVTEMRLGSGRAAAVARKPRRGPGGAAGADLGGSSKYSNESFEGRSGEGFHVNSS